ncbi:hypothetical protein DZF91_08305 [Actinomadura logoneensis]|uniref:Uncharacterized protein n=1 Tax=Actinomadura logoneensis TaxID=2293572 RepID=A0A372JQS0_9ACTN|nr:hypothetical protein [Actinomadura logoneensis]RFU42114.1 hypothetical protein DZF91_08305 [Actinomadura logoneensis]
MARPSDGDRSPREGTDPNGGRSGAGSAAGGGANGIGNAVLLPLLGLWICLGATLFHGPVAAVIVGSGTLAALVTLYRVVRHAADERLRRTVRHAALRAPIAGLAFLAVSGAVYAAGGGGDASETASGVLAGLGAFVLCVALTLVAAARPAASGNGSASEGGR